MHEHTTQAERLERLKDAIEGECEGLAIGDEQAREILAYLDTGLPPDERPRTSGWLHTVRPPDPTKLQWEDEAAPAAPTLQEALGRLRASIAWLRDGRPCQRGIGVADMVVIEAALAAQPAKAALAEDQVAKLYADLNSLCVESESPAEMFAVVVRGVERAHGIGQPSREGSNG